MKKNRKNYTGFALFIILIAIAIGYSLFGTKLTVNGTATNVGTWNIQFKEVNLKNSLGQIDTKHGNAIITSNISSNDTISANITLNYPGDAVVLETIVQNLGSVPAKLTKFTINGADDELEITQPEDLENNESLHENGGVCRSEFLIKWATNSSQTYLNKTFTITFEYKQDTQEINYKPIHVDK